MALRHASAERGGSGGARAGTGRAGRAAPGGRRRDAHPPRLVGAGRGGADRRALRGGARRRGFKPVAGYLQHGGLVPESRSVTHPGDSVAAARRIRPSASQACRGTTMVENSTTRTSSRRAITSQSSGAFGSPPRHSKTTSSAPRGPAETGSAPPPESPALPGACRRCGRRCDLPHSRRRGGHRQR